MDEVVEGAALVDPDVVPEVVADPLLDPELEFELLMLMLLLMLIEIDGTKQKPSTRLLVRSATQREFWAALKIIPSGPLNVLAEGVDPIPWLNDVDVKSGWPRTPVAEGFSAPGPNGAENVRTRALFVSDT